MVTLIARSGRPPSILARLRARSGLRWPRCAGRGRLSRSGGGRAWVGRYAARWLGLALLVGWLGACAGASGQAPSHPLVGKPLAFSLPDLTGKQVRPEDYRGRVVLVDIWATWCKPCSVSLPIYAKLARELDGEGFSVLAVSIDEEDDVLTDYLAEHPLPFPILRDPDQTLPSRLKVDAMPTAVLVGRDGRITYVHSSFHEGEEAAIEAEIRRALDAPARAATSP